MREFRDHGSLRLNDGGIALTARTTAADLDALPTGMVARRHSGRDEMRVTLQAQRLDGAAFHVTLLFTGDRLAAVELVADDASVASIGAGGAWTRGNELARKAFHEQWAAAALDRPLAIKPWRGLELPEPVTPACPGPEHARHAVLDWGELASCYDDKAGFAFMRLTYATVP